MLQHEVVVNDRIVPNRVGRKIGRGQHHRGLGVTHRSDGYQELLSWYPRSCIFTFPSVTLHMSQDMTGLFKTLESFSSIESSPDETEEQER